MRKKRERERERERERGGRCAAMNPMYIELCCQKASCTCGISSCSKQLLTGLNKQHPGLMS